MLAVFIEPLLYISRHMQAPIKAITYTYNTNHYAHFFPFYSEKLPHAGFEPPIARECLLEFDTCSNDPSQHGWYSLPSLCNSDRTLTSFGRIAKKRLSSFWTEDINE